MKIKSRPQDFVVEELLDLPEFSDKGNHFIYKLEKSGLSTLEVVNHLVRRFRIHDKKINFAGMKDKHALTSQYLSIMVKELKKRVSQHWGNWEECLKSAPPSNERKVLTYLRGYPRDFVKAINLINPRLLSLFIAAYQSYIWNEMVGEFIKINLPGNELIKFSYTAGEMVFYKALPKGLFKEFAETQIPLIDHKVKFQGEKIKEIGEGVMKTEGVEIENFRLNKIKKAFFKSVSRRLIVIPEVVEISDSAYDEISPNASLCRLSLSLVEDLSRNARRVG